MSKSSNENTPQAKHANGLVSRIAIDGENDQETDESIATFTKLNFSASVNVMLSGLPPPKRKRVRATESVFSDTLVPKKLTTLLGKRPPNSQTKEQKLKLSRSIASTDSDDSDDDLEDAKGAKGPKSEMNGNKVMLHKDGDNPEGKEYSNPLLCALPKARTAFDLKKTQMMIPDSVKNRQKAASSASNSNKIVKKATSTASNLNLQSSGLSLDEQTRDEIDDTESESISYFNLDETPSSSANSFYAIQSGVNSSEVTSSSEFQFYDDEFYPEESSISTTSVQDHSFVHHFENTNDDQSAFNAMSAATSSGNLDADALHRLQGRRKRENIEIVDVNAQDQLEDVSIQVTKGISEETDSVPGGMTGPLGAQPGKGDPEQRRAKNKHQLNWLVSQAKAREVQLKNQ